MSLSIPRSLLRPASRVARSSSIRPARAISTSLPRRGGHDHHHHDDHHADAGDYATHESWFSKPWLITYTVVGAGIVSWPFLPTPIDTPASPALSPDEFHKLRTDPSVPWLTRSIAKLTQPAEELEKLESEHIDETFKVAESKLVFQSARQPAVRKPKSKDIFAQASPYGVAVGTDIDVSDVKL